MKREVKKCTDYGVSSMRQYAAKHGELTGGFVVSYVKSSHNCAMGHCYKILFEQNLCHLVLVLLQKTGITENRPNEKMFFSC